MAKMEDASRKQMRARHDAGPFPLSDFRQIYGIIPTFHRPLARLEFKGQADRSVLAEFRYRFRSGTGSADGPENSAA
jgi:hypothetical protein